MRFFPSFNTFIEIGPLSIQWYAVCILTGAAIAYFLGQYHFKKLGYSKEILSDYVFGLLFVGIIGARIWYVIFMWNELYANNPMEIIMINHGGLSSLKLKSILKISTPISLKTERSVSVASNL